MVLDRFAVLSDIHGNLWALDAVLADVAAQGITDIVNLGDILSGPLKPRETAERLMPLQLPTIRGNHERQLLACADEPGGAADQFAYEAITPEQRAWLAGLPVGLMLGDVQLSHGIPGDDMTYLLDEIVAERLVLTHPDRVETRLGGRDPHATLLLCGHSHQPRALVLDDGLLIVNPGSVGLPAYDDENGGFHRSETGCPHASYAVCERGTHGWNVALHRVAYDWHAAAKCALANDSADWASWLASGFA
ncbi:metallophosphoesterase family protein [Crenobacter sp. SG2303]|uniref:Metallophosphoesterase family protein n=2 Tax=Crenobacter oryzisoli TaxID=3056844 RepID=A0ABT7XQE0_9NEIS|nr:metallophosphoesterase family protein [Crenobacter sp. SG2303]